MLNVLRIAISVVVVVVVGFNQVFVGCHESDSENKKTQGHSSKIISIQHDCKHLNTPATDSEILAPEFRISIPP